MVEIIDERCKIEYHFDDIAVGDFFECGTEGLFIKIVEIKLAHVSYGNAVSVCDGCRAIFDSGDIVRPVNVQLILK